MLWSSKEFFLYVLTEREPTKVQNKKVKIKWLVEWNKQRQFLTREKKNEPCEKENENGNSRIN